MNWHTIYGEFTHAETGEKVEVLHILAESLEDAKLKMKDIHISPDIYKVVCHFDGFEKRKIYWLMCESVEQADRKATELFYLEPIPYIELEDIPDEGGEAPQVARNYSEAIAMGLGA